MALINTPMEAVVFLQERLRKEADKEGVAFDFTFVRHDAVEPGWIVTAIINGQEDQYAVSPDEGYNFIGQRSLALENRATRDFVGSFEVELPEEYEAEVIVRLRRRKPQYIEEGE